MIRRSLAVIAAISAGLVAGGAAGFLARGEPSSRLPPAAPGTVTRHTLPVLRPVKADTLLAWTPGGLPAEFSVRVADLRHVDHVVAVASGIAWLTRSFSGTRAVVDRPSNGLAFPIEVAGADLGTYAPFLAPADRAFLSELARGEAMLGRTSAELRGIGLGGVLQFGARRVRVAGVVPDTEVGANEVFVSRRTAASLGVTTDRYLLIDPAAGSSRARLSAHIRALLPAGLPVRIRGPGETPYFRQGDAVLPQVRLKELFGEFAARPAPGGTLIPDPVWERRYIVTTDVPILGTVRCNRALLPQLRGALSEVAREGLSHLISASQYGGCYSPRFLLRDPNAGISHHAWGIAVDLNVQSNPFGHTPHMDPRIVDIFKRWGFKWGGDFLVPDGMHFEFTRFASGT